MNLHPADSIRDGRHRYHIRVYYEDTDAGGVVYHANYLRFAERARTEALRDLGVPHVQMRDQHGLIFMVRRVKLDYLAPASVDDSLMVESRPMLVRAASVELRQSFYRVTGHDFAAASRDRQPAVVDGRLLAVAEVQLACVRVRDQRPDRLPARWRDALQAMIVAGLPSPEVEGD